jgi:hypothetical protein
MPRTATDAPVVPRPPVSPLLRGGRRGSRYPVEQILSTLGTTKAIRVELGDRSITRVVNGIAHHVRRRGGLHFRYLTATDGKAILAWVEPKRRKASA